MSIIEKYDMLLDVLNETDCYEADRYMKNITNATSEKAKLALERISGKIDEDEFNARYQANYLEIVEAIKWLNDKATAMKTPVVYEGTYDDVDNIRNFCNDLTEEWMGELSHLIDSVLQDSD